MSETLEKPDKLREVIFNVKGDVPTFRVRENGKAVEFFEGINSENEREQQEAVERAYKWAGVDLSKDAAAAKVVRQQFELIRSRRDELARRRQRS
jgi:hypothetical protein